MSNRVGLRLSAQSRLVCLVLVHVLLHVLKAWALLVHVAAVWVWGTFSCDTHLSSYTTAKAIV